jgi:hypothetical protein
MVVDQVSIPSVDVAQFGKSDVVLFRPDDSIGRKLRFFVLEKSKRATGGQGAVTRISHASLSQPVQFPIEMGRREAH